MSTHPELAVDLSASYAHRAGDDIHVVLRLADETALDAAAQLQLRAGRKVVRTPATSTYTPGGRVLDARVPAADLRPGVWRLGLVDAGQGVQPVEARLLNARRQPIALLPGPTPRTELAPPQPARAASPAGTRGRAYRAAGRVADKGLALLPEQRATRYRALLKKAGRRVLS